MNNSDYKNAYGRQRKARERAEDLLEVRSRELYEANETLKLAYNSLQEQKSHLIQKEKLASIGLLATGVAHELNNPIGFIKSNLQVLEDYLTLVSKLLIDFEIVAKNVSENPDSVDYRLDLQNLVSLAKNNDLAFIIRDSLASVKESLLGADRVQGIVVNLKGFARTDMEEWGECDLNECIDDALKLVWNAIKYKVDVHRDYGVLPVVHAISSQLNQVFVNIIINASQAMKTKGDFKIRTRKIGQNIQIEFIDSGPGIPEDNLMRIFDPFFTTKDVNEGTGLGLYISHELIKNHRGSIAANNEPEGGVKFTVLLPIAVRE